MAVEIKLSKFDNTPWGFRLVGGSDFDTPLTVIKVTEGSIAEESGLRVGDTVVRVNDTATAPLTHAQAHDIISQAGNNFTLAVFRGAIGDPIPEPKLLSNNTPVTDQKASPLPEPGESPEFQIAVPPGEKLAEDLEVEAISAATTTSELIETKVVEQYQKKVEEKVEFQQTTETKDTTLDVSSTYKRGTRSPSPARAVQLQYSVKVEKEENKKQESTLDQKWSTFLQKPKGPKPKPKAEDPYIAKVIRPKKKVRPYTREHVDCEFTIKGSRVIMGKLQRRLSKDMIEDGEIKTKVEVTEEENDTKDENREETIIEENEEKMSEHRSSSAVTEMSETVEKHVEEKMVSESLSVSETKQTEITNLSEMTQLTQKISEVDLSMEEQLAQVQKKLLELSQLPAAIQATLNAVTEQLSKIVKTDENTNETVQNEQHQDEEVEEMPCEETENPENEIEIEEGNVTDNEINVEENEPEEKSIIDNQEQIETTPAATPDPESLLADEEQEKRDKKLKTVIANEEARQILEDQQLKHNIKKPSFPSTPLQRPIILPGGKRWHEPDDVIPCKINAKKYTDELIAETISSQSEILMGTTLGINFLKYQPQPPKNLDHLKHSEVYKMVHALDSPSRGIAGRPGLVMAEADYLQAQEQLKEGNVRNVHNPPTQVEP